MFATPHLLSGVILRLIDSARSHAMVADIFYAIEPTGWTHFSKSSLLSNARCGPDLKVTIAEIGDKNFFRSIQSPDSVDDDSCASWQIAWLIPSLNMGGLIPLVSRAVVSNHDKRISEEQPFFNDSRWARPRIRTSSGLMNIATFLSRKYA